MKSMWMLMIICTRENDVVCISYVYIFFLLYLFIFSPFTKGKMKGARLKGVNFAAAEQKTVYSTLTKGQMKRNLSPGFSYFFSRPRSVIRIFFYRSSI